MRCPYTRFVLEMIMEREDVESSVIDAVGYSRVLELQFESGRIYQYYDVPQGVFDGMGARSQRDVISTRTFAASSITKRLN